jgi:hypothetical protein
MPLSSSSDLAIAAAHDLVNALRSPSPASPISPLSNSQHAQLVQLASIFADATGSPASPSLSITSPPPGFQQLPPSPTPSPRVPTAPTPSRSPLPRVPNFTAPTQPTPRPKCTVTFDQSVPSDASTITYIQRTGNAGKRRQQLQASQKRQSKLRSSDTPTATRQSTQSKTNQHRRSSNKKAKESSTPLLAKHLAVAVQLPALYPLLLTTNIKPVLAATKSPNTPPTPSFFRLQHQLPTPSTQKHVPHSPQKLTSPPTACYMSQNRYHLGISSSQTRTIR